jgi:hypothetical protein
MNTQMNENVDVRAGGSLSDDAILAVPVWAQHTTQAGRPVVGWDPDDDESDDVVVFRGTPGELSAVARSLNQNPGLFDVRVARAILQAVEENER